MRSLVGRSGIRVALISLLLLAEVNLAGGGEDLLGLRPYALVLGDTTEPIKTRKSLFSLWRVPYGANLPAEDPRNKHASATDLLLEIWESAYDLQEPKLWLRAGYPLRVRPQGPWHHDAIAWIEESNSLWLFSSTQIAGSGVRDDRDLSLTAMKIPLEGTIPSSGKIGDAPIFESKDWPLLRFPAERFVVDRTGKNASFAPSRMTAVSQGSAVLVFLAGHGPSRSFQFLPRAEPGQQWKEVVLVPQ